MAPTLQEEWHDYLHDWHHCNVFRVSNIACYKSKKNNNNNKVWDVKDSNHILNKDRMEDVIRVRGPWIIITNMFSSFHLNRVSVIYGVKPRTPTSSWGGNPPALNHSAAAYCTLYSSSINKHSPERTCHVHSFRIVLLLKILGTFHFHMRRIVCSSL